MNYYAVIVGGGSGNRMQSETPKQFMLVSGKPLIMYTIEAFYDTPFSPQIILVLNSSQIENWKRLCLEHNFQIKHTVIDGGKNRFDSVKNSIEFIDTGIVAIQDGVRPLTNSADIIKCYQTAEKLGNAVLGSYSSDSVRLVNGAGNSTPVDRRNVFLVQTPQVFKSEILKAAYSQPFKEEFTDDASVVESIGVPINLVEASGSNLKVTYPADLVIAEAFLNKKEAGK